MADLSIVTMPTSITSLSDAEVYALQNVVGLAEDLSMRGDDRATVVLNWARDLLKIEAHKLQRHNQAPLE